MSEKLLNCPFCQSEAEIYISYFDECGVPVDYAVVRCTACYASTGRSVGSDETKRIALCVKTWNRRPSAWVECSERMPEERGGYLITGIYFKLAKTGIAYFDGENWIEVDQYGEDAQLYRFAVRSRALRVAEPTAWQPLPEPFQPAKIESDR